MHTNSLTPRFSRPTLVLLVVGTFFLVNAIGLTLFHAWAGDLVGWPRMAALGVLGYGLYLLGPLAVAAVSFGRGHGFDVLGLRHSPLPALLLAGACTAIVWIGYAAIASPVPAAGLPLALMRSAILPGIAEEILFRAFLFGFLYRFAGWGFLPAALLSSLVFGMEHWYQGSAASEALGIVVLTGLGGVWWSWLLVEWRWNAWVPIAFHVGLNAAWETFDMADDALGPLPSVGLRFACIALSILITVALARRRGGRIVTGRRWWRGPSPD